MRKLIGTNIEFAIGELALFQNEGNRLRMFFYLLLE